MTGSPESENQMPEAGQTPAPTVWPPPPINSPAMASSVIPPVFIPLQRLALALVVLLGLYAVLAVLGLTEALSVGPTPSRQIVVGVITFTQSLLLLGTGICFLIWTYRLHKNLRAFGITGLRSGPGWAAAYFVIPILSIYRPYQVFREIWQASSSNLPEETGNAWRTVKTPALLGFWWISFLLLNLMDTLSSESLGATDIDAADNAAGFISALLALQMVRLWTARQTKTARSQSLFS